MAKVIRKKNPEGQAKLKVILEGLDGYSSKVGFFESSKYEDGTPVAQAAAWNELGTNTAPPRSFMRTTTKEKKIEWRDLAISGFKAVVAGNETVYTVMEKIGQVAAADIRNKIRQITSPPLSPITIELRKLKKDGRKITGTTVGEAARNVEKRGGPPAGISTKPLIETGILYESVENKTEATK